MSRYIENAKDFMGNYRQIRSYLDKNDIIKDSKIMSYQNKLNDNKEILKELEKWCSNNGSYFLAAPTGSGKTYTFSSILKKFVKNTPSESVIVSILEPTVVLCEQASKLYNMQAIVGGESDVDLERMSACVIDKVEIFLEKKKELEEKGRKVRFIFVLDECHDLISDQFRSVALRKVARVMEELKGQSSIIYTTATFDNCYTLDVEHFLFCNPTHEFSVGKIVEYRQQEGVPFENYINTILLKELEKKNGTKFCIRINSKNIIESIKYELTQKGFKVETLTADDKKTKVVKEEYIENGEVKFRTKTEYVNKTYASVLQGIVPSDIDVLLVTCLLDEGVSFNQLSDGTKPRNIVPCFVYDMKNYNLLDYKQFVARFRFELDMSYIFVARQDDVISEEIPLVDVVKFYKDDYWNDYQSFELSLRAAKIRHKDDEEKIEREMRFLLAEITVDGLDGNNLNETIIYENGKIIFDVNKYFNNMYNKYMQQFTTNSIARVAMLERMFACNVEIDNNQLDTIHELAKFSDVVVDDTIAKLEEVQHLNDKEVVEKARQELGLVFQDKKEYVDFLLTTMNKRVECARAKDLTNLVQHSDNLQEVLELAQSGKKEEIKALVHTNIQKDFGSLSEQEVIELKAYLENGMSVDSPTCHGILDSSYKDLIKQAHEFGLSIERIIKVASERDISEFRFYLKETQAIVNNKIIMGGEFYKGAGVAYKEQAYLVMFINEMRQGAKTFVISNDVIDTLIKKMKGVMKKDYTKIGIKKFVKLVYSYNEREVSTKGKKSKVLTIKDLRKQHKSSN